MELPGHTNIKFPSQIEIKDWIYRTPADQTSGVSPGIGAEIAPQTLVLTHQYEIWADKYTRIKRRVQRENTTIIIDFGSESRDKYSHEDKVIKTKCRLKCLTQRFFRMKTPRESCFVRKAFSKGCRWGVNILGFFPSSRERRVLWRKSMNGKVNYQECFIENL